MERIIDECFTQDEVSFILSYGIENFHVIESTDFNTKYRDLDFSLFWKTIYPKIKDILPTEFVIKGGFLNETSNPYLIHSDGARTPEEKLLCTVLLPLKLTFFDESKYDGTKNKLFIFNQTSDFATTFRMNDKDAKPFPYYRLATSPEDYRKFVNGSTGTEFADSEVLASCDHLTKDEFFGMSLKLETEWKIGKCIIFHPHNIHTSTNFKKLGIQSKTNLVYSLLNK